MPASSGSSPNTTPAPTAREARVAAGLIELEQWLFDLARQGLATLPDQPYRFWENMAAALKGGMWPAGPPDRGWWLTQIGCIAAIV